MIDVFISYAREDQTVARLVEAEAARLGHDVWMDDALPAHRSYGDVIAERIDAARAVIVLWSRHAVASEWVRAEANRGREGRKLIQAAIEPVVPPMPFDQLHVVSLADWRGEPDHPGWRRVRESLAALAPLGASPSESMATPVQPAAFADAPPPPAMAPPPTPRPPPLAPPPPVAPSAPARGIGTPTVVAALIALTLLVAIGIGMMTVPNRPSSPEPVRPPRSTTPVASPASPQPANPDAPAPQGAVIIRNQSGQRVVSVNIWTADDRDQGPNRLGPNGLRNGEEVRLVLDMRPNQCIYNIRVIADDGTTFPLNDLDRCRAREVPTLTLRSN